MQHFGLQDMLTISRQWNLPFLARECSGHMSYSTTWTSAFASKSLSTSGKPQLVSLGSWEFNCRYPLSILMEDYFFRNPKRFDIIPGIRGTFMFRTKAHGNYSDVDATVAIFDAQSRVQRSKTVKAMLQDVVLTDLADVICAYERDTIPLGMDWFWHEDAVHAINEFQ